MRRLFILWLAKVLKVNLNVFDGDVFIYGNVHAGGDIKHYYTKEEMDNLIEQSKDE